MQSQPQIQRPDLKVIVEKVGWCFLQPQTEAQWPFLHLKKRTKSSLRREIPHLAWSSFLGWFWLYLLIKHYCSPGPAKGLPGRLPSGMPTVQQQLNVCLAVSNHVHQENKPLFGVCGCSNKNTLMWPAGKLLKLSASLLWSPGMLLLSRHILIPVTVTAVFTSPQSKHWDGWDLSKLTKYVTAIW